MKKIGIAFGAFAGVLTTMVPVFALSAGPAMADPSAVPLCPGGDVTAVASGSYKDLTITGNDYVATGAIVAVTGNLTVAPGACLDAFNMATVTVGGNVLVGQGATLALGCSVDATEPGAATPCTGTTEDTVSGNIVANQALTMYLTADTVWGNVISNGGGPGLGAPPSTPYTNFPIKDNQIHGNLVVQGWQGAWDGALRNTVAGNLIFSNNASLVDPDSNEVTSNTVDGNLICVGNSPAAQLGDAITAPGAHANVVSGRKLGQCALL